MILSAVVCAAIYMMVTPPPATERVQTEPASRTLAYQERIARAAEEAKEQQTAAPEVAAPAATPPAQAPQAATTPKAEAQPSTTGQDATGQDAPGQDATEMAGLPPDEEAPSDPNALPWQQPRSSGGMAGPPPPQPGAYDDPYGPRPGSYGPDDPMAPRRDGYRDPYDPRAPRPAPYGDPYDPNARQREAYGDPYDPNAPQREAYGDPYDPNAPRRYGDPAGSMAGHPQQGDPNGWPGAPDQRPQEWVQVLVSGVGMHGTASEDSPMLFAFPYGRVLMVVSRYGDWVEVTDPNSATTGWMRARYLAPVASPEARQAAGPMYEEERRRGRGWLRRLWRSF